MKYFLKFCLIAVVAITLFACKQGVGSGTESGSGSGAGNGGEVGGGSGSGGGSSLPEPDYFAKEGVHPSLQAIIDAATEGKTIGVIGTFRENVTVDKTLTFVGYGESGGTINGGGKGSVMTVSGAGKTVTIRENMTLTGGDGEGSGIKITSGNVILDGGTISGNGEAADQGFNDKIGTIAIKNGATFTMSDGSIRNNFAYSGGGVAVEPGATFIINGGSISGNTATFGGGVHVTSNKTTGGTAIFNGGTITTNRKSTHFSAAGIDVLIGTWAGFDGNYTEGITVTIKHETTIGSLTDYRK